MGDERKDGRPRILDFSAQVASVTLRRDLAWPCAAYRVTVPVRPTRRLNVFEDTVLKLLAGARMDERILSDMTCLDGSLIRLVCCRLRDLGLISDYNEVEELGHTYLTESEENPHDYEVRVVFRELVSGALLPVVYDGSLRYEELLRWSPRGATAEIGKANRRPVRLRLLRRGDAASSPPSTLDVLRAANRHRELSRQFAILRGGGVPYPHVDHSDQMNVDLNPESVFLRVPLIVPTDGDDYRIYDPFGYGYSELLFRAYEGRRAVDEDEQEYIQRVRAASLTTRPPRPHTNDRLRVAEEKVRARLAGSVSGYRQLFLKLRQAEKELQSSGQPPRNSDEEAHFAYHSHQAAQSLAEAVEEALRQVVASSRPAACESLMCSRGQSHRANGELLVGLSEHLGFETDGIGGLLRVPPGRVRGLRDGGVDLQALIAVALAAAAEAQEHPARILASRFSRWLLFVRELKAMRDAGAHGQSRAAGTARLQRLREGTYRTIELLLPGLRRARAEMDTPSGDPAAGADGRGSSMERAHDARRQAISRLEVRFGIQWYAAVNQDVAELFIQLELAAVELALRHSESVNAARSVNDLASIVQAIVHSRHARADRTLGPGDSPTEVAKCRAIEAGLLAEGAELPVALATVRARRIREALQGRSPTLGASLIALLVLVPGESLRSLAVGSPDFLGLSERLLDLRGHGNRPVFLTPEELLKLRDEVYTACDALMEA